MLALDHRRPRVLSIVARLPRPRPSSAEVACRKVADSDAPEDRWEISLALLALALSKCFAFCCCVALLRCFVALLCCVACMLALVACLLLLHKKLACYFCMLVLLLVFALACACCYSCKSVASAIFSACCACLSKLSKTCALFLSSLFLVLALAIPSACKTSFCKSVALCKT